MQITLKQSHVEAAIRDYVAKAGITFPVDDINFTAGRGKDGLTATVEMEDPFAVDAAPSSSTGKTVKVEKTEPAFTSSATASVKAKPEPVEEAPQEEEEANASDSTEANEPTLELEEEPVSQPAPPFAAEEGEPEPTPAPKKEKVSLFG